MPGIPRTDWRDIDRWHGIDRSIALRDGEAGYALSVGAEVEQPHTVAADPTVWVNVTSPDLDQEDEDGCTICLPLTIQEAESLAARLRDVLVETRAKMTVSHDGG